MVCGTVPIVEARRDKKSATLMDAKPRGQRQSVKGVTQRDIVSIRTNQHCVLSPPVRDFITVTPEDDINSATSND